MNSNLTINVDQKKIDSFSINGLKPLIRAIKLATQAQEYSTILARFNYPSLRRNIIEEVKTIDSSLSIRSIILDKEIKTLYQGIKKELGDEQPSALMVFGLESVADVDQVLRSARQDREKIAHEFSCPLVLWLTDDLLSKLIRLSPDFASPASVPIEIDISTNEGTDPITNIINSYADKIFGKILEWGAGILREAMFSSHNNDWLTFSELKLAKQSLEKCGSSYDNEFQANLEFLLGYSANNLSDTDVETLFCCDCNQEILVNECRRKQYENSLELYQKTDNLKHQACVLYYLGSWWLREGMSYPIKQEEAFKKAKDYWQQCVKLFRKTGDEALEGRFINAEAEGLKRVKNWEQLEKVGQRAQKLHKKNNDDFRLARINGFLAEVEFYQNQNWREAKKLAEDANYRVTETLHNPPDKTPPGWVKWTKHYHRGWYLLPLAKAEYQLQEIDQAMGHLEEAKEETEPEYDPELYISILEELQKIYYQQGKYEAAFSIKQEQREIEQQFGFRAFIGLSPLPRKRRITNPALLSFQPESVEANVIGGSDRANKVNELIAHIGATHHKLIVVYGGSGVGKSSLLRAKLIPALQGKNIGTQKVLPILISQYPNWFDDIGSYLKRKIYNFKFEISDPPSHKIEKILEQLQKNNDNNVLTVLIFDNLEELCFSSEDPMNRQKFANYSQEFANFLQKSLEVLFVKVILSVREDYLYYLLNLTRLADFNIINDNILDKDNLYYIGYLELDEAKVDILELTQNTTYSLEESLLDRLVNDLATTEEKVIPMEKQMVGMQLENNEITILEDYEKLTQGVKEKKSKEILLDQYLEEVTQDCGRENKEIAEVVLYCLTGANNIRPKKTYDELQDKLDLSGLGATEEQIDVVLSILTMSGLIKEQSFFSDFKNFAYHLAPDHLTKIIQERFHQKYPKLAINLARKRSDVLQDLAIKDIKELNLIAQKSFAEHDQLQALEASLESGGKLKTIKNLPLEVQQKTKKILKDIIYGLEEYNHFDEHQSDVYSVDFSRKGSFTPDGRFLASASWDKTIEIWDVKNDRLVDTLEGHEDAVNSVKISPDGKLLASASADQTIKVWLISWNAIQQEFTCEEWKKDTLSHDDWVWDVCFSPDGKMLASAGGDRLIKLWQLNWSENYQDLTIQQIATLQGHTDKVYTIDFSPDGQTLASGGEDNTIKLWDVNTRKCETTLRKHNRPVKSVRFSHSGQYLASASEDGTIQLWDIQENQFKEPLNPHKEQVNSVSFREDDQVLASGGNDNTVKLWTLEGDLLKTFRGHRDWVRYVEFSPDGKLLASTSDDNTIKLRKLDFILPQNLKGHIWKIHSICFSPDGQTLASGGWDGTIRLWNRQSDNIWKETKCISDTDQNNQPTWVWEVSFSPDGQTLVTGGGGDNLIKLWSLNGELPKPKVFGDHQGAVHTVRFSPDGKFIASGSGDYTVKLWDAETGELKVTCGQDRNDQHTDKVWGIEFSRDGQILASTGADRTIKLWDLKGNLIRTIEGYHKEDYPEGHKEWINGVAFNPNGKVLASASNDNTIKLWDLSNGNCLNTLAKHNSKVYDVGFSPDGEFLISASADKTLKIWSKDGTLLRTLEGHSDWVNSAMFSPDGQLIASASNDRTIKIWDLSNIKLEVLSFEDLLKKGRNWLQHYENAQNNRGGFRQKFHR